jgi:tetratricopeptide (TPR) repeat protein
MWSWSQWSRGKTFGVKISGFLILGVLFLGLYQGWAASPPPTALLNQAQEQLQRENYEEALELLTQAWRQGVRTPEAALLLGQTYRALLNYREARVYLEEAVRLRPGFREAQFLLADTLVGLDQPALARPILHELEAAGFNPGPTAFALGLAYYKEKQYEQALTYFRRAQADPKLAQEAKFQESMALAALMRLTEAKKVMQEAISLNPQSPTAGFAQGYASVLDRRLKEYQRFRFTAAAGFDFDSNVTLQPGAADVASLVSGREDVFWSLAASLEYNFLPPGPFALWGFYGYFQTLHHKLSDYDLISNSTGVVPVYTWSHSRLWVPLVFNNSLVGYKPYLTSYMVAPTYLYLFTPKLGVEAGLRLYYRDYWFAAAFPQDVRTGRGLGASLAGYYFLKNQEGYLVLRFSYDRDWTLGRNWDSNSYRLTLGFLYPVTQSLKVRGSADFILQPYDNFWFDGNPFVVHPKRHDKIFIGGLELTQRIYKNLELSGHYYFVRDDSNTPLYDYHRHIVGVQLGYRY